MDNVGLVLFYVLYISVPVFSNYFYLKLKIMISWCLRKQESTVVFLLLFFYFFFNKFLSSGLKPNQTFKSIYQLVYRFKKKISKFHIVSISKFWFINTADLYYLISYRYDCHKMSGIIFKIFVTGANAETNAGKSLANVSGIYLIQSDNCLVSWFG